MKTVSIYLLALACKAGAKVKLVEYEGGHGWHGPLYDDVREGVKWLEKNHAKPAAK